MHQKIKKQNVHVKYIIEKIKYVQNAMTREQKRKHIISGKTANAKLIIKLLLSAQLND